MDDLSITLGDLSMDDDRDKDTRRILFSASRIANTPESKDSDSDEQTLAETITSRVHPKSIVKRRRVIVNSAARLKAKRLRFCESSSSSEGSLCVPRGVKHPSSPCPVYGCESIVTYTGHFKLIHKVTDAFSLRFLRGITCPSVRKRVRRLVRYCTYHGTVYSTKRSLYNKTSCYYRCGEESIRAAKHNDNSTWPEEVKAIIRGHQTCWNRPDKIDLEQLFINWKADRLRERKIPLAIKPVDITTWGPRIAATMARTDGLTKLNKLRDIILEEEEGSWSELYNLTAPTSVKNGLRVLSDFVGYVHLELSQTQKLAFDKTGIDTVITMCSKALTSESRIRRQANECRDTTLMMSLEEMALLRGANLEALYKLFDDYDAHESERGSPLKQDKLREIQNLLLVELTLNCACRPSEVVNMKRVHLELAIEKDKDQVAISMRPSLSVEELKKRSAESKSKIRGELDDLRKSNKNFKTEGFKSLSFSKSAVELLWRFVRAKERILKDKLVFIFASKGDMPRDIDKRFFTLSGRHFAERQDVLKIIDNKDWNSTGVRKFVTTHAARSLTQENLRELNRGLGHSDQVANAFYTRLDKEATAAATGYIVQSLTSTPTKQITTPKPLVEYGGSSSDSSCVSVKQEAEVENPEVVDESLSNDEIPMDTTVERCYNVLKSTNRRLTFSDAALRQTAREYVKQKREIGASPTTCRGVSSEFFRKFNVTKEAVREKFRLLNRHCNEEL